MSVSTLEKKLTLPLTSTWEGGRQAAAIETLILGSGRVAPAGPSTVTPLIPCFSLRPPPSGPDLEGGCVVTECCLLARPERQAVGRACMPNRQRGLTSAGELFHCHWNKCHDDGATFLPAIRLTRCMMEPTLEPGALRASPYLPGSEGGGRGGHSMIDHVVVEAKARGRGRLISARGRRGEGREGLLKQGSAGAKHRLRGRQAILPSAVIPHAPSPPPPYDVRRLLDAVE